MRSAAFLLCIACFTLFACVAWGSEPISLQRPWSRAQLVLAWIGLLCLAGAWACLAFGAEVPGAEVLPPSP